VKRNDMIFRKLKRVWSNNDMNYIPNFREIFPELNKVSSEDMCDRWCDLGIDFYTEKQAKVPFWVRLTLPFAILLYILMLILMPIRFIIKGTWGYDLGKHENRIYNWFKSLSLL